MEANFTRLKHELTKVIEKKGLSDFLYFKCNFLHGEGKLDA